MVDCGCKTYENPAVRKWKNNRLHEVSTGLCLSLLSHFTRRSLGSSDVVTASGSHSIPHHLRRERRVKRGVTGGGTSG